MGELGGGSQEQGRLGEPGSDMGWGNQALKWAGGPLAAVGGTGGGNPQYRPFKKLSKNPSRQSLVRE